MLGEFIYNGIAYCVKKPVETDYSESEVIHFNRIEDVKQFFSEAIDDPVAWPIIMTIAKWYYPSVCRPPANRPEPKEHDFLNTLCNQIFKGELALIEVNQDRKWILNDLKLAQCCVVTIKDINKIIISGDILFSVVFTLPLFQAFFYPPGYSKWAGLASTLYSIGSNDWRSFGDEAMRIPSIARKFAYKAAKEHALLHEWSNDYKLKVFWQGVTNAFE